MSKRSSPVAPSRPWLGVAMAGVLGYFLLYWLAPLPSLTVSGETPTRGGFLIRSLLLPDEVVRGWLGDPPRFALLDRLPMLLLAAGIGLVGALLGRLMLRALGVEDRLSRLESWTLGAGVGLNTLSLYTLALGLLGLLHVRALALVPMALVIAAALWRGFSGGRGSRRAGREGEGETRGSATPPLSLSPTLLLLAPFAAAILLGGLLPPVEFDVREYHLQAPKEFYQQGQIAFLPHNVYANMPLGAEMPALFGMVAAGDWWLGAMAGKTLIALFAPLTALLLLAAGRRWFSTSAGVLAALIYISIPWIARVSNLGLIDGVLAYYLFAALYAAWLFREAVAEVARLPAASLGTAGSLATSATEFQPPATRYLLLAGFLAGAAVSCKYPALVFVVAPLAVWVCAPRRADSSQARSAGEGKPGESSPSLALRACVFAVAVFAGCGLWLAKNAVLTGNPVYPLAADVLGGATRTPEKIAQWQAAHRPSSFSPASAVNSLADVAWRSEWLSPLVLPLALLAWLAPWRREAVKWLWLYFAYVILAWWLLTHRIDRFWIPTLPVLALLAGAGATWTDATIWRRFRLGVLVVGLLGCFFFIVRPTGGDVAYFASYEQLRHDPARHDPWHLFLNENLRPGEKALLVGDAQGFDLSVPILYNTVFDANLFEQIAQGRGAEEIHAELAARHIAVVYVHWGEIARYRSPGNYGFPTSITPKLFESLVEEGVLAPLPMLENHPGQLFRVLPSPWPSGTMQRE